MDIEQIPSFRFVPLKNILPEVLLSFTELPLLQQKPDEMNLHSNHGSHNILAAFGK